MLVTPLTLSNFERHGGRACRALAVACLLLLGLPAAGRAQQIEQAVQELTGQILDSLQAEGKTKIAVIELTDLSGQVTPLGRLVAEELISQLFTRQGGRLKLIERSKLDGVLGEQRLGIKGLLEKQNVEAFGRVLGVEAILTGTIAVLEDRVRINARLIAVPSAELFATASTYLSRKGLSDSYFQAEAAGGPTDDNPAAGELAKPAGGAPVARQDFKGISYELLGCTRETRLITCHLVLTNNGADRQYYLGAGGDRSFLYDQRGHQFHVSRARLADVEYDDYANKYLITEIPTEAKLFFEGVPSSIEFIKILHLKTADGVVEFRDVHFSNPAIR